MTTDWLRAFGKAAATVALLFPIATVLGMVGSAALIDHYGGGDVIEMRVDSEQVPSFMRPSWDEFAPRYPRCVAEPDWPDGEPARRVFVQDYWSHQAPVVPMPYDRMDRLNSDRTDANDVYLIAVCK